ncbi:MAG: DUF5666 domain-containing protein [Cyanobacteria bacterium P01_A01_bin.83]
MITNISDLIPGDDNVQTISGTVTSISDDDFILEDSTGEVLVDAEGFLESEGNLDLSVDQEVTVVGDLDDEDFDARSITSADASQPSPPLTDDDSSPTVTNISDLIPGDDNVQTISGTVTSVSDDDFILEDSTGEVLVDVFDLEESEGNLDLSVGQEVTVVGDLDDEDFDADSITFDSPPMNSEDSETTVYRFLNTDTGVHFYTGDDNERDTVENLDNFIFEGASYESVDPLSGQSTPVYRFLNEDTGVHLYTVSETERDTVENLDNFIFEGEAFSAYETEVEGSIPIYRFFNSTTGAHFYTPSAAERDSVESDLADFQSEGIAYYALPIAVENQSLI